MISSSGGRAQLVATMAYVYSSESIGVHHGWHLKRRGHQIEVSLALDVSSTEKFDGPAMNAGNGR
jgi:hypothetical protein